jgi:predicted RNA-binding Zn-ribbon protein involved in translation (DUF1610 family)
MKVKTSVDPSSWGFNGRIKETDAKFRCPHCNRLLEFKDGTDDKVMICPTCGYKKII